MKKDVLIYVKGMQEYSVSSFENSSIEFFIEGKFYKKGESYFVMYKESELIGFVGMIIIFKIQFDFIILICWGDVILIFVFESGKRYILIYIID